MGRSLWVSLLKRIHTVALKHLVRLATCVSRGLPFHYSVGMDACQEAWS